MSELFPIIDAALADAAERSGQWLACKPGCHQCCVGVFPISQFDAASLRDALSAADPSIAGRIRARVRASVERLTPNFPGDPRTGILFTEPGHEDLFEDFANDEPCPVLDPLTGTCDLYAARPVPCRTFGPPIKDEEGHFAVCELCFVDAPLEEVARCEMDQTWRGLEEELIEAAEVGNGVDAPPPQLTLVAFALRTS